VFGFGFFIYSIGILLITYLIDLGLNFIFNFSIFLFLDNWANSLDLTGIEKVIIIIPLILFFMRGQLFWMSKDHDKYDDGAKIYNPFSDWGNITYMKKHKNFYDKYYANDYIKWKKKEEKRKNNKKSK